MEVHLLCIPGSILLAWSCQAQASSSQAREADIAPSVLQIGKLGLTKVEQSAAFLELVGRGIGI